jgi:hypothetical protein
MWLDTTNHIDLYDVPAYVDPAVARVTGWLAEHLGAPERSRSGNRG